MKTRALLLVFPLLAAGCRDNSASVQIQALCAPTADCTFSAACDAQYIGFATVDATQTGHLWMVVQVANQLANNANAPSGRTNTNDAHVDQVALEYDGAPIPGGTFDVGSYRIPAAGSAVISVEVIPRVLNAAAALGAFAPTTATRSFVANFRLRGYYDDGSRFETGAFPVDVRVCSGCLTLANGGLCPTIATCPPESNGQLPITCP